ncbi:MAG: phosphoglycerate kinase, partial [Chloroflexi bacterium]|nr:phosphoglycerate kinase [Chloroflexota bacterium]
IPDDGVMADRFAADATSRIAPVAGVGVGWRMLDIGPATVRSYADLLRPCKTVLWNGPMGVFEWPAFAEGTRAVARCLADLDATTIVGGGETVQAIEALGLADRFTHLSTGGGASLEFLEGKTLPGVAALADA